MSPEEYANLMELLGRNFARIEERFAQIDARFDQVDARFDRLEARFDQLEARVTRLEVLFEDFRHDMRALGEIGVSNGNRIGRIERHLKIA